MLDLFLHVYLSYVLSVFGFATMWLAGNKRREAWALGLAAQAFWLTFAIANHQYGLVFGAVVYGSVYLRNYLRWSGKSDARRDMEKRNEALRNDPHHCGILGWLVDWASVGILHYILHPRDWLRRHANRRGVVRSVPYPHGFAYPVTPPIDRDYSSLLRTHDAVANPNAAADRVAAATERARERA